MLIALLHQSLYLSERRLCLYFQSRQNQYVLQRVSMFCFLMISYLVIIWNSFNILIIFMLLILKSIWLFLLDISKDQPAFLLPWTSWEYLVVVWNTLLTCSIPIPHCTSLPLLHPSMSPHHLALTTPCSLACAGALQIRSQRLPVLHSPGTQAASPDRPWHCLPAFHSNPCHRCLFITIHSCTLLISIPALWWPRPPQVTTVALP